MWAKIHFCPQDAEPRGRLQRPGFVVACGLSLACVEKPVGPPSYDYQVYLSAMGYRIIISYDESPAPANSGQYWQRYAHAAGDTVTPLSADIAKLLGGLLQQKSEVRQGIAGIQVGALACVDFVISLRT